MKALIGTIVTILVAASLVGGFISFVTYIMDMIV